LFTAATIDYAADQLLAGRKTTSAPVSGAVPELSGFSLARIFTSLHLSGAFAVTAAFVINFLIPSSLLAAVFASIPAWRWFDPVPILNSWDKLDARSRRKRSKGDDFEVGLEGLFN
jgi:hypothetical protein